VNFHLARAISGPDADGVTLRASTHEHGRHRAMETVAATAHLDVDHWVTWIHLCRVDAKDAFTWK
jgi:hypothetical protein